MPTSACGERRRVVDAVAGHRDDAALACEPLDDLASSARAAPRRCTSSMPSLPRDRLGRRAAVAGQHDDRGCPRACSCRNRLRRASSLIGSATPSKPGELAVDRDEHHASGRRGAARRPARRAAPDRCPSVVAAARRCRARPCAPSTVPDHALAGQRLEVARRRQCEAAFLARRRRSPRRADARCRARGRREAQHVVLVEARRRHRPRPACGLPSVSVPVLSTTSVSTFSSSSSASAFLTSTPGRRAAAGRRP